MALKQGMVVVLKTVTGVVTDPFRESIFGGNLEDAKRAGLSETRDGFFGPC